MKTLKYAVLYTCILVTSTYANTTSKTFESKSANNVQLEHQQQINTSKIIYEQQFSTLSTLGIGWKIPGNNPGRVYIDQGFLWIDGRQNALIPTSLILPQLIQDNKNYQIELEFTLADVVNESRWAGLIYQVQLGQGVIPTEYYQFTIRQNTTLQNGTEFGRRLKNGKWQVETTQPYPAPVLANQIYTARIEMVGNRVQHYLNQQLVQEIELADPMTQAEIGFSTAGALMKIKSIKVSEILEKSKQQMTQNNSKESINISGAPILITKADSVKGTSERSSRASFYQIDQSLRLLNTAAQSTGSLLELIKTKQLPNVLILEVQDIKTVEALKQHIAQQDFAQMILVSKKTDVLDTVNSQLPWVKTALDLTDQHTLKSNPTSLNQVIRLANGASTKIVILPKTMMTKSNIRYIQQRLMNVWLDAALFKEDLPDIAQNLTLGANGILTKNPEAYAQLLKQFPRDTLLRSPFMIAHRGVPSLEDENTLESAVHAMKLGADLVENDIQLTKDLKIVVMHDNTIDRTTTAKGKVVEMTWAELSQLKSKNKNYKIPLLSDYFKVLKQHKNVVLMVEMKSANPELIRLLKKEIEQYDVSDQVVLTSFNHEQILRAKQQIPEISTGILIGYLPNHASLQNNVAQVVQQAQQYHSSYHPPFRKDLVRLFSASQGFGVSFWPWNLNDEKFKSLYLAGISGVTTDHIQNYGNFVLNADVKSSLSIRTGQVLNVEVNLTRQNGEKFKDKPTEFIVLEGAPKYSLEHGQLKFLGKGTAYVLVGYRYAMDTQNRYSVYSEPIQINIK
ncbi:glycerophosphodiester phosphodiesterase family protein [Acinetobacter shaoyimingii]|uniref:DUF1080 domain-containing protein n=1 Tax=Acinetobacter shaoyimingii TaxID=2715164 RepID=A0A6G8RZI4_9GAMM|nr:glycerophosphodiester phosphodiesterase family protein [Acinetobacter shaoyimingii]QIO07307.1 DUF1080 domain-containing protein [Acinetobacter shaoyimingii]